MIALCTVLSGGQTAVDMSIFAREKEMFLREFLKARAWPAEPRHLQPGVPAARSGAVRRPCFQRFMARFAEACHGVDAIDAKVVRRSFDRASTDIIEVIQSTPEGESVEMSIARNDKEMDVTVTPKRATPDAPSTIGVFLEPNMIGVERLQDDTIFRAIIRAMQHTASIAQETALGLRTFLSDFLSFRKSQYQVRGPIGVWKRASEVAFHSKCGYSDHLHGRYLDQLCSCQIGFQFHRLMAFK